MILLLVLLILFFPASSFAEPTGVSLLGVLNSTTSLTNGNANHSWIDIYAARTTWQNLDTVGSPYDFTYIDAVVNGCEAINKKFTLCIHPSCAPAYVVSGAGETYTPTIAGTACTTPVPWDSHAIGDLEAFVLALSNHVTGAYGALKSNPLLVGVRIGFMGLKGLDEDDNDIMVNLASYNRTDFTTGMLRTMHAWADAFPAKAVFVEIEPFTDHTASPRLDSVLIDAFMTEFDGTPYQNMGVFIESMSENWPTVGSWPDVNLVHARSHGSWAGFQAVGVWGVEPYSALKLCWSQYRSEYYELYNSDLNNGSFEASYVLWHAFFAGTGPYPAASILGCRIQ